MSNVTLDMLGLTRETISAVKALVAKSITSGFTSSTGAAGFDLAPFVSLVPVDTPFYDSTPRLQVGQGALQTVWETYANLNSQQRYQFTALDESAPLMLNQTIAQANPMSVDGVRNLVTLDAIAQGQNYVDAYAVAVLQAINQKLIQEDIIMLNALNFSIGALSASDLALSTSTTGGSIPASTAVDVAVAARSGYNYYAGGSTASVTGSITTGSTDATNSVTVTLSNVPKLAVAYDWFVGGFYYTTTSVPTVTVTAIPTANQTVPNTPELPLLYQAGQVFSGGPPTTDTSYSPNGYTGLVGSILADLSSGGTPDSPALYVTPGTGVSQGSLSFNLAGESLTVQGPQVLEINEAAAAIFANWQLSPTRLLAAPNVYNFISQSILSTVNAVNFFSPTSVAQHQGLVGAGSVPVYIDTVTGAPIQLQVQPHLPPGVAVLVNDQIPFPGSNIGSALQVRTEYDNFLFLYGTPANPAGSGPSGPRWDFEVRTRSTFVNYAAPTMAVFTNIYAPLS